MLKIFYNPKNNNIIVLYAIFKEKNLIQNKIY